MSTGMNADWSWDRSAREYTLLYEEIRRRVRSRNSLPDANEPTGRPLARP